MSVEAAVVQYRKEFVASFEQRVSLLKATATKESVINGNQATFLVSGSGGDTAVTRGTNGQIPYGNPTNSQVTATLAEKHAPYELTSFNIFASQGDQKRVMQMASMNVINRDIDLTMLAELANATQDFGSGTASLARPKNSRHTVRMCFGIRCRMKVAEVMSPSVPSFCTPGSPPRNLSVTSLPSPSLRSRLPSISSVSSRFTVLPSAS